jgi:outer membrane protein assembly factor BamE (lipoprotein component of BamABCDE complex)
MQLQEMILVKLRFHLCIVAFSLTATAAPLMAQTSTPIQNQFRAESQGDNKPSFLPKILTDSKIKRQPLKSSLLYEGMVKAEVEKVMGKPTDIKVFSNSDLHIEILNYRQEPVITKISMIDGYLSGITCELKTITTNNIPPFAQGIKIGMSRQEVLKLMGEPFSEQRNDISIYKLERLAYVKDGQLPVNVILTDGRVQGVNVGLETPDKILQVILPAEPAMPKSKSVSQSIRIGMNPQQVISIYGQPTFVQPSVFKQQKVVDFVYATLNTDASTRFTFINDVLTRFSFVPQANLYRSK